MVEGARRVNRQGRPLLARARAGFQERRDHVPSQRSTGVEVRGGSNGSVTFRPVRAEW